MDRAEVTLNAIKNIKLNPAKLSQFKIVEDKRTEAEYIKFVSTSIFTYIAMKENAQKFAKLNELSDKTQADISYLFELLAEIKTKDTAFRILPIIELYESLLRENWEVVKYERDILDATESYGYTAESNMKICKAIITFLKENVLSKSYENNINY